MIPVYERVILYNLYNVFWIQCFFPCETRITHRKNSALSQSHRLTILSWIAVYLSFSIAFVFLWKRVVSSFLTKQYKWLTLCDKEMRGTWLRKSYSKNSELHELVASLTEVTWNCNSVSRNTSKASEVDGKTLSPQIFKGMWYVETWIGEFQSLMNIFDWCFKYNDKYIQKCGSQQWKSD